MKYRVYYNVHRYADGSGPAMPRNRIVHADSPDEAREKVRTMESTGTGFNRKYIGMVHQAEEVETP